MGMPVKVTIEGTDGFLVLRRLQEKRAGQSEANAGQSRNADQEGRASRNDRSNDCLADNNRVAPRRQLNEIEDTIAALAKLSDADRALADRPEVLRRAGRQPLGSMGPPVKIMIDGQPVFLCCDGLQEEGIG